MTIDFAKYPDGLVPVIVQDAATRIVLMLGFMNQAALDKTNELQKVTFFSRSKQRLWTKGEESGNFLTLKGIAVDCDNDTLLVKAIPHGPVCHTGAATCFSEINSPTAFTFLSQLTETIRQRDEDRTATSYTSSLFAKGVNSMAQKVGEEAVELVIEAKDNNDDRFISEAADLLFHYMVLLQSRKFTLKDVEEELGKRKK